MFADKAKAESVTSRTPPGENELLADQQKELLKAACRFVKDMKPETRNMFFAKIEKVYGVKITRPCSDGCGGEMRLKPVEPISPPKRLLRVKLI